MQTGADPQWLLASAAARAEGASPDLLAWLARTRTELDRQHPQARAEWLGTGARRQDIVILSGAGYRAATAWEVAASWRISLPGAAKWLAEWVTLGYRPTPCQLACLREAGRSYPPPPPSLAAVARISGLLDDRAPDVTTLAIELLIRGTAQATVAVLRRKDRRGGDGRFTPVRPPT
jgi:hypothetical protein